ncbi:MAG TPA: RNA ligase, partial [Planococcus sp. (in: firmicutes)]|nr:RNA ligase [Planococcus sp. (in: firmicutes)]
QDDEFYIFVGDFVDRGIQNAETLSFLFSMMDRKNVVFLEGNHEIHLWNWANGRTAASKEFEKNTRLELERNGVSKKTARSFYRTLHQCFLYTYGDKRVLVTHGGLPHIPDNLLTVPTEQLIKGVGDYNTEIDLFFTDQALTSDYQIHGHRNIQRHPTQVTARTFNLEGRIEKGGHLRTVSLTADGFYVLEVKNTIFNDRFIEREITVDANNHELLQLLRSNKLINERKQPESNISSFNFKREVFHDALWNSQTTKARGLFFNTETAEIVARSYDKFFNIGEMRSTELASLESSLMFPVQAYVKPNGFLGITGVDAQSDQLIIASKSTTAGPYKEWFETILMSSLPGNTIEKMKEFMNRTNTSFIFEVIDPNNDPHMVEYEQPHLVLLDIIYRTPKFDRFSYEELQTTALEFGMIAKERAASFADWQAFAHWHDAVTNDWSLEIEGFVLEDSDGFMTKIKLPYYSFWKWMRSVKDRVAKGQALSTEALADPLAKRFIDWLELHEDKAQLFETDIITLRKAFEKMAVSESVE